MKFIREILIILFLFASSAAGVFAAVGCDLNDPDRDVKRLFPDSSGYKTLYVSLKDKGGPALQGVIEKRLGDKFRGIYENVDVPYTIYEIYKGKEKTGYIHGVNQKGVYGGIQVFLSLDLKGVIKAFYIQKLTSRQASALRSAGFAKQFVNLSLKEFNNYDIGANKFKGSAPAPSLSSPSLKADADFRAILRAVKKNLILMDEFVYNIKGGN